MYSDDEPIDTAGVTSEPYPSWFWYGRYEASVMGTWAPPDGFFATALYWLGHQVGRHLGPPNDRHQ